ncbi:MAG: phosphotransferase [Candidatus Latescibacteria bacterium]|nr:phosphotransferase [Candidatus Latescibacterota bacterium]
MTASGEPPLYTLPSPQWLQQQYGIEWDGQYTLLGDNIAQVVKIHPIGTDQPLVMRISDPQRLAPERIEQVHRCQAYLQSSGVFTPLPRPALQGQTVLTTETGGAIELFPFIDGRPPRRGHWPDTRLVAEALTHWHNAGSQYLDLPGEESLYQNHVALDALCRSVRRARERAPNKAFGQLYLHYTEKAERWTAALQTLRGDLVDTSLHLDTGPQNMLIDIDNRLWFIDCNHMLRGRRVFEVCTTIYYMDPSSVAPRQNPRRYQPPDPELAALFLQYYQAVCAPPWTAAEDRALPLEHMLLLIHGATYWTTIWDEDTVQDELSRFYTYWKTLRGQLER